MLHQRGPWCRAPFGQRVAPALALSMHANMLDPGAVIVIFPLSAAIACAGPR